MEEKNFPNIFDEKYDNLPPENQNRFERSKTDFIIAGVCSGIAKYFKVDTSIVRLIAILSFYLGIWIVAFYLLLAYLTPTEKNKKELTDEEITLQRKINLRTIISGIMIFIGIYFGFSSLGFFSPWYLLFINNSFLVSLVAISLGVFILERSQAAERESKTFISNKFTRIKKGKMFFGVCKGLAKYLNESDVITIRTVFIISTMLTLGLMIIGYIIIAAFTNYEDD